MTNVKKTLSVLLAFVLVLGTCMFSAFAAGTDTATIKVVPDKTTANVGDVITVSVKLDASYAVASTSAIVKFNTADFELVAGSLKLNDTLFGANKLATDAVAYKDAQGVVGAYFVAKKGAEYKVQTDAVLFSFQLKALKANANAALTLPTEELKSTAKPDGKIYCGKGDAEDNIVEVPCKIALTDAAVNIGGGAVATPELVCKQTGKVAAYQGAKYVYGVAPESTTEAALNAYFEAKNGKLVWTAPTTGVLGGTGTVLELQDNSGKTVETYTLVIFGDVDGTATIDGTDDGLVNAVAQYDSTALAGVALLAADVDATNSIDGTDKGLISAVAQYDALAVDQTIGFPAA